ncbi:sensor histidine kinase [Tessaracoccus sp.]
MNPGKGSLARRLMVGQSFVVLGMTLSIVVAALLIGPAVFDDHMRQAGHGNQPDVLEHAQEAFFSAGLQSIGVGLLVAAVGALAVSLITTRRLGHWLNALTGGASRVSAGHYDEPVVLEGSSSELERVADAFNSMASQIETTESRRRSLLTDVAHELRTPIAAMDVTLEALEDGVLAPGAEAYATLRSQSARLARLACDIRDVSAAEEGRQRLSPRPVSASELVDSAAHQWRHRFEERGVTLTTPVGQDVLVDVDPARVEQVLDNLLANALRHTRPGGHITVRTRALGAGVAIDVMDDGEGIGPEALLHVMERFYRADSARTHADGSGSGVGLAISLAIARAHGGDLTAVSEGLGRGSTFTLSLPSSPNLHRIGA